MKKYLTVLWLFVMAISSLSFVACSSDDDTVAEKPKDDPSVAIPTYAKFEIRAIEDMFELGDFMYTQDKVEEAYDWYRKGALRGDSDCKLRMKHFGIE